MSFSSHFFSIHPRIVSKRQKENLEDKIWNKRREIDNFFDQKLPSSIFGNRWSQYIQKDEAKMKTGCNSIVWENCFSPPSAEIRSIGDALLKEHNELIKNYRELIALMPEQKTPVLCTAKSHSTSQSAAEEKRAKARCPQVYQAYTSDAVDNDPILCLSSLQELNQAFKDSINQYIRGVVKLG